MEDSRILPGSFRSFRPLRFEWRLQRKYVVATLSTVAGIALVLLATWTSYEIHLNLAAASLLELLVVLAVALKAGFWSATVVSVIANCCLNYFFIPPLFSFYVADPQNWMALGVFEISALVVSRLSTEARRRTDEALTRRAEMERLYEVSQQLLLLGREQPPGKQILFLMQRMFSMEDAALFDNSGPGVDLLASVGSSMESELRGAYLQNRDSRSPDGRTWFRVLRFGVRPVGAIGFRGDNLTDVTVNALASLAAIALERAHSFERETRAEAERQSEQLRTTVLDALAHEYQTPLTVVRTATSGLIEIGSMSAVQAKLVGLIDSETARLSELTTRLLQMSRLDRADLRLRPQRIDVDELVHAVLALGKKFLVRHTVRIEGLDSGAHLCADRELVTTALIQFIDNAAKYSDPDSTITVGITALPHTVRISVHNAGPLIPFEHRTHIFERFHRGPDTRHTAAGSGIGLSISKKVADAHQGRVWVTSDEQNGNTFFFELPRLKSERI